VRLRDPDLPGDLALGQIGVKPQDDDPTLAFVERAETAGQQDALIALGERVGLARPLDVRGIGESDAGGPFPQLPVDRAFDGRRHERRERDATARVEAN
jgi:hypothetical protein